MTGIILASHGGLAEGVKQSAAMVFGPQEDVAAVTLLPEDSPDSFREKLVAAVSSLSNPDKVLFLVDLLGGTPYNQSNALLHDHEDSWAIVTGLSLPMVIIALGERMGDEDMPAHELAQAIIEQARESITVTPASLEPAPAAPAAADPATMDVIPPGTVLGDGHIKYVLARVDSRLLHGQVATSGAKATDPDRIIVVSDAVAKDTLRKELITKAAPPGIKAHVVPLQKLIDVERDPRFGATKALLLFENPQDALTVIKAGVSITRLNVGSMAHSVGKVQANTVISMEPDDVDTFIELKQLGIEMDIRKVPSDTPDDIDVLLKRAQKGLSQLD